MPAVAFSDSGNLMGAFHFVETGYKHNESINLKIKEIKQNENVTDTEIKELENTKILPIVGCEFQICSVSKGYKHFRSSSLPKPNN